MKNELRIAILQIDLAWEDPKANRHNIESMMAKLPEGIDLVVLPEMFTTGFSMAPERTATPATGPDVLWFAGLTAGKSHAICGSMAVEVGGKYFNRFLWSENGKIQAKYDKKHLFTMAGEHLAYTPGLESPVIEFKGWRILPRICYDLRFPVWCRSTDVDIQIYVANWPQPRIQAWDTLLSARAIENQAYVIGANRLGKDANNNKYVGHSAVFDAKGTPLTSIRNEREGWIVATINRESLKAFRERFPFFNDADAFSLDH